MKPFLSFLMILLLLGSGPLLAENSRRDPILFQYSAINALLAGVYEGDMSMADLARHGDTGLGTINGIDGEMLVVDGKFYSIKADGRAYVLAPTEKTPFAVMAFLRADLQDSLAQLPSIAALTRVLDQHIATLGDGNAFQVIRIDGDFSRLALRSEPKQSPPYRPLAVVMKEQQVNFELKAVRGTLIGFRIPDYMTGLNVPGYHFHFITEDRSQGGHVLNLELVRAELKLGTLSQFEMALPQNHLFKRSSLGSDREKQLQAVEQQ